MNMGEEAKVKVDSRFTHGVVGKIYQQTVESYAYVEPSAIKQFDIMQMSSSQRKDSCYSRHQNITWHIIKRHYLKNGKFTI
jgi:hypothetical protein